MAVNADRIVIAGRARIYIAVVGTAAPVNSTVALDAAWREVGYTTEDDTEITTDPSFGEVRSHQSDHPTRRFQTADAAHINASLQEWSDDNFKVAFGGGTATEVSAGQYKFVPPIVGGRGNVAAIVEVIDGIKAYRWVAPKVFQDEGIELPLHKTEESVLALSLGVIGADVGDPLYLLTNDAAFNPAA